MARWSKTRCVLKWVGTVLFVLLVGAFAASYWRTLLWADETGMPRFAVGAGQVWANPRWGWPYVDFRSGSWPTPGWHIYRSPIWVDTDVWWPYVGSRLGGPFIQSPLWFLSLVVLAPTAMLWIRNWRVAPGHCGKCGYDLTGNVSGRCPECGTAATTRPSG